MLVLQAICSFVLFDAAFGFFYSPWNQITSCSELPPSSPSGMYSLRLTNGQIYRVYCEMGINGGGYTFIPREMMAALGRSDMKTLFRKPKDVLLRISRPDGSQPYTVISPLYGNALSVMLNGHQNDAPKNKYSLGAPYIYLNTVPAKYMRPKTKGGMRSNGKLVTYRNCDNAKRNQFTFFANLKEKKINNYHGGNLIYEQRGVAHDWRESAVNPPSGSRMPLNFFLFTEMHYGGCGAYTSSDRWIKAKSPAHGTAIGLR